MGVKPITQEYMNWSQYIGCGQTHFDSFLLVWPHLVREHGIQHDVDNVRTPERIGTTQQGRD